MDKAQKLFTKIVQNEELIDLCGQLSNLLDTTYSKLARIDKDKTSDVLEILAGILAYNINLNENLAEVDYVGTLDTLIEKQAFGLRANSISHEFLKEFFVTQTMPNLSYEQKLDFNQQIRQIAESVRVELDES